MRRIGLLFALLVSLLSCKQQPKHLTIYFTGDLLLDRGVRWQIQNRGVVALFDSVRPFFANADFVVANLECPVTKHNSPINKRFIFRGEPEWLDAVKQAHITHLMMTNNHSNDQGRDGLTDTYNNIKQHGMVPVGYGNNQSSACEPTIIRKNGIVVALFGSVLLPLENFAYLPDMPGVCQAGIAETAEHIKAYKQAHPDAYAIAVLHWGVEYQPKAGIDQYQQAHQLIDAGADAIVGHHPHVVQATASYKGKPIYFSLGNFVFDQGPPGDEAMVLQMDIDGNKPLFKEHKVKIVNCTPAIH